MKKKILNKNGTYDKIYFWRNFNIRITKSNNLIVMAEKKKEEYLPINPLTEQHLKNALEMDLKLEIPKSITITESIIDKLIDGIAQKYKTEKPIAYVGLCTTLQAGGSNRSKRSNVKITISDITFESRVINDILQKTTKITPRQFARIISNDIFKISTKYQITGNAFISLQRFHAELLTGNPEEEYWASDFQSENSLCPENIRDALRKRYLKKFSTKS